MLVAFLAEKVSGRTLLKLAVSVYISPLFISTLCGHFTGYDFVGFKTGNWFYGFSVNSCLFSLLACGVMPNSVVWVQTNFCDIYI